ncbi:MAG: [FeFe] hydrogenase H-cluster radical SAM maturase HydG [Deltaproteobacteria bacterium]|nr:[FeFe] hydrogenase H-cluster radical SAM maturase HydG [Deltaproteobacteria bacterium]
MNSTEKNQKNIEAILSSTKEPSSGEVLEILETAKKCHGLTLEEASSLLAIEDLDKLSLLFDAASLVKEKIFGKRIVLFAPLYLSSNCTNGCLYCGFRSENKEATRKTLNTNEAVEEASKLLAMGFKRILLVTGETPSSGLDYICSVVRAIYKKTGVRILHVNSAPMETNALKELKASGLGLYQVFQETYHSETYKKMHPYGAKKDYDFRLNAVERALSAGFNDVGIGALLGLYDFKFDVLSTINHSKDLFAKFGTHAHTISVPRLRPAKGSDASLTSFQVSDEEFKKIVAVYRLSVPSAGVVVSTRESAKLRAEVIRCGASQMSAASQTSPGGYNDADQEKTLEQFSVDDTRSLMEVMTTIITEGSVPSLCTTCYRKGRVGSEFNQISLKGEMRKNCEANAILTLREFILDNPLNGLASTFDATLEKALGEIKDEKLRAEVADKLEELNCGKRDLNF